MSSRILHRLNERKMESKADKKINFALNCMFVIGGSMIISYALMIFFILIKVIILVFQN